MVKEYDAFISYAHEGDTLVAKNIETGLKQMRKKWNELRAMEVFRDESSLTASPHLWDSLAGKLEQARFLIVLLSPEAAASSWVQLEISHFLDCHSEDRILLVLTDGKISWDDDANDWDPTSTAVPDALYGRLKGEPCWVDLSWARETETLTLQDPKFRSAIATLAAPVHGVSKDDLDGQDVRAHEKTVRIRRAAVTTLVVLLGLALVASVIALISRSETAAEKVLRRQVEFANTELDAKNRELDVTNAELRDSNFELDSTNNQLDEVNEELQARNSELDSTNDQLDETNEALNVSNRQLTDLNSELESINRDLDRSNEILDETNQELEAANAEISIASAALKQSNLDLEDANSRLTELEAFASDAAGAAICQRAKSDAAFMEKEAAELAFASAISEMQSAWLDIAKQLEEEEASIESVAELVHSYEYAFNAGFIGVPPPQPIAIEDGLVVVVRVSGPEVTCSQLPSYPYRDSWDEIGDPVVNYYDVASLPDCGDGVPCR